MNQKALAVVIVAVLFLTGLYLLGAFIAWNFNPAEWPSWARVVMGIATAQLAYKAATEDYDSGS